MPTRRHRAESGRDPKVRGHLTYSARMSPLASAVGPGLTESRTPVIANFDRTAQTPDVIYR